MKNKMVASYRMIVIVSVLDPCDRMADWELRATATTQGYKRGSYSISIASPGE